MAADEEKVRGGLQDRTAVPWFGTLEELNELCAELDVDPATWSVHGTLIPMPAEVTHGR